MPQLVPVVVNDRKTTPVAHTFVPRGIEGGVATLVESTGVPLGDKRLTISLAKTGNGRSKVTIKMAIPIVQDQTVGGVTQTVLLRTAYVETTLNFDATSTKQERADASQMMTWLLHGDGSIITQDVIEDLEGVY